MAENDKPEKSEKAKAVAKKAVKKKASTKKRTAAKKATAKRAAPKKHAAKQQPATVIPDAANDAPPSPATRVEVVVERPDQNTTASTTPRHVWWRAALMVAVVVLLFVTIRNAAHNEPTITAKTMAPNPWGKASPSLEAAQPHPWELAPVPEAGNFDTQQPYRAPQTQQPSPRLEPWQPLSDATQPYYPPPPGPYGSPPPADETIPYPR